MIKIKSITIVTSEGVKAYTADAQTTITPEDYSVGGDLYPCFIVKNEGVVYAEIRCVHNLEITYQDSV